MMCVYVYKLYTYVYILYMIYIHTSLEKYREFLIVLTLGRKQPEKENQEVFFFFAIHIFMNRYSHVLIY